MYGAIYKCRKCGTLFQSTEIPNYSNAKIFIDEIIEKQGNEERRLYDYHECDDVTIAIADLQYVTKID